MRQHNNFFVFFLYFFCFLFLGLGFRFGPLVVEAKTVVISDNFDDGVLNPDLWEVFISRPPEWNFVSVDASSAIEINGRLEVQTSGDEICVGVRLKKIFSKQYFKVSVNFDGSGCEPPDSVAALSVHNACNSSRYDEYMYTSNGFCPPLEQKRCWVMLRAKNDQSGEYGYTPVDNKTGVLWIEYLPQDNVFRMGHESHYSVMENRFANEDFFVLLQFHTKQKFLGSGSFFENFVLTVEEPDTVEPASSAPVTPAVTVDPPPTEEPSVVESPADPPATLVVNAIAEPAPSEPVVEPVSSAVDPPVEETDPAVVDPPAISDPEPTTEEPVPAVVADPISAATLPSPSFSSSDLLPPKDPPIPDPNGDYRNSGGCFIQSLRY